MGDTSWESLGREQQRQGQMARFRRFLKEQILPYHPYYRELFQKEKLDPDSFRTLADLARLPFSEKSLVAPTPEDPKRPRQWVLQPDAESLRAHLPLRRKLGLLWRKLTSGAEAVKSRIGLEYRPIQVFFTTGRTSLPTSFFLSRHDLDILEEVGGRIARIVGVDTSTDRVLSLFPYAPHLAFWQVHAVGLGSGTFTLQTGGGRVMGTDGILQTIRKLQPTFLCGIPGYVYHVLREGVEQGIDLSPVRTVFLGGDRMVGGYREKLRGLLERGGATDPRILSVLGFTEARKCWTECSGAEETGFHTYPDLEIFEIVDPETGEVLPEGETGELVYTPIAGRGSLVLRYRTGDIVNGGMTTEPCPACGRTVPRFSSDLSRSSNVKDFSLTKIKGSLVNLNRAADVLNSHAEIDEWQLVIRKKNDDPFELDELLLYVAPVEGARLSEEAEAEELKRHLHRELEVSPSVVEFLPRDEVLERLGMETQLKEKRIVDLRPTARAAEPSEEGLPVKGG